MYGNCQMPSKLYAYNQGSLGLNLDLASGGQALIWLGLPQDWVMGP